MLLIKWNHNWNINKNLNFNNNIKLFILRVDLKKSSLLMNITKRITVSKFNLLNKNKVCQKYKKCNSLNDLYFALKWAKNGPDKIDKVDVNVFIDNWAIMRISYFKRKSNNYYQDINI